MHLRHEELVGLVPQTRIWIHLCASRSLMCYSVMKRIYIVCRLCAITDHVQNSAGEEIVSLSLRRQNNA